ncbi:MAG: hypothetical protein M3134_08735 [Actinomycetota bacterium]|nr:hypothetical protein [Actinomycetota bacterium]
MRLKTAAVAGALLTATLAVTPSKATPAAPTLDEAVARAQTGGDTNEMFVQFAPPQTKRYGWSVLAYKRSPRSRTVLAITFGRTRARGTQTQSSEFRWELPRGAMATARDLKPASVDTRRGMGNNGFIDMRLTHTEGYLRAPAEQGCTGAVSIRFGRFGGRFRFNARDQYFKRIAMRGVPGIVYREHDYRCVDETPPPACFYDLELEAFDEESGVLVAASKTTEGRVDQRFVAVRPLDTGTATHSIFVTLAVPEAFEASDDLTSASVDGDLAEPWLTGDLSYVGPPGSETEGDECGPQQASSGLVTGDYAAHFDSIGDVTLPATGMGATLQRRAN